MKPGKSVNTTFDRGSGLSAGAAHGLGAWAMKTVILSFLLLLIPLSTAHAQKKIAIVKSKNINAYNEAVTGFTNALKSRNVNATYDEYLVTKVNLIGTLTAKKPDIIYTLGTSATKTVSKAITTTPVVFAMVMDPRGAGIQGSHVTGASLDIPPNLLLQSLKRTLPGARTVGVIYNPAENNNYITTAKRAAQNIALNLKTYPAKSSKEIPDIKDLNIDALWMIPDTVVCKTANVEGIFLTSLKLKIPVMGISSSYAKAGAIMAVSCDYKDIGTQAGEIAQMILNGTKPGSIAISKPRKTKLYLNLAVADRLKIKIPGNIVSEAAEVYGK
jgi:putative ABC transport system substrate-binding protein